MKEFYSFAVHAAYAVIFAFGFPIVLLASAALVIVLLPITIPHAIYKLLTDKKCCE